MAVVEIRGDRRDADIFSASRVLIQALVSVLTLVVGTTLVATSASATTATGTTLDFESLANGESGGVSAPGTPGFVFDTPDGTVTFSNDGVPSRGRLDRPSLGLAAFNTDLNGPNAGGPDPDLLVDSGIALIIQARNKDSQKQSTPGIFDTPNDFSRGGVISAVFSGAVSLISVDVIDINGNGPADLILTDGSGLTRTYALPLQFTGDPAAGFPGIVTVDLTSLLPQVGVGIGTPSSSVSQDAGFDANDVRRLDFAVEGSGALDNLTFVPEPSTAVLFGLGLAALSGRKSGRKDTAA